MLVSIQVKNFCDFCHPQKFSHTKVFLSHMTRSTAKLLVNVVTMKVFPFQVLHIIIWYPIWLQNTSIMLEYFLAKNYLL